jgi:prepilin-type N-terminal cleavage/methylation domain-containing protein
MAINNKGFTLIELVVVIVIFGILLTVGTNVFFQVVMGANKASIEAELRQNASFVMENITRDVRKYSCILVPDEKTLYLFDNTSCSLPVNLIYTINADGGVTRDSVVVSSPKVDFNNPNSKFTDLDGSVGRGVTVSLEARQKTGSRWDYIGTILETQTVTVRNSIY